MIPHPRLPDIPGAVTHGIREIGETLGDGAVALEEHVESSLNTAEEVIQSTHEHAVDFAESPVTNYTDYGNPSDVYTNERVSDAHGATVRQIVVGELNAWGTIAAFETGTPELILLGTSVDGIITGAEVMQDLSNLDPRGAVHHIIHFGGRTGGSIIGGSPAVASSILEIEALKVGAGVLKSGVIPPLQPLVPGVSSLIQVGPATVGGTKNGDEWADRATESFDHAVDSAIDASAQYLIGIAYDPGSLLESLGSQSVAANDGGSGGMDFAENEANGGAIQPDPSLSPVDTSADASFDFSVWSNPAPIAPSNPDPEGLLPLDAAVDTSTDASIDFPVWPDPAPPAPSNPDPEGLLPLNTAAAHAPPPSVPSLDFFW
ncbi:MAG: hypothetical protein ACKVP5_13620 [Aestuariivirga sp.]